MGQAEEDLINENRNYIFKPTRDIPNGHFHNTHYILGKEL